MFKAILVALMVLGPTSAIAQAQCAPRASAVQSLGEKYGETRQAIGLAAQGQVVEVFANLESGSWTVTVTRGDGVMCLLASGERFELLVETLPPEGDPT